MPTANSLEERSLLFVYGTLMSTSTTKLGTPERRRLFQESVLIGPATMSGELLNLGDYPGFVTSKTSTSRVHGEILALHHPSQTFDWLDDYECVSKNPIKKGEYSREYLTAERKTGEVVRAWVYVFLGSRTIDLLIPSGSWPPSNLEIP